jgi:hypothetical protein
MMSSGLTRLEMRGLRGDLIFVPVVPPSLCLKRRIERGSQPPSLTLFNQVGIE